MQKRFACLAVGAVIIFAAGCALFDRQERRINYTETLNSNDFAPSVITDAKQRAIINMKADVGTKKSPKNGTEKPQNKDDKVTPDSSDKDKTYSNDYNNDYVIREIIQKGSSERSQVPM